MSFRTISKVGLGAACFENGGRVLVTGLVGPVADEQGMTRSRRRGGFWNKEVYEFPGAEYESVAVEPRLTWRFGFAGWWPEKIESSGFGGVLVRQEMVNATVFRLGSQEWRYDEKERQLSFRVLEPVVALRVSLMAFRLFKRCAGEERGGEEWYDPGFWG